MSQLLHTPFYQAHVDAGAKLVDFSGWELPIHYGSQIKEHEAVRTDAGMFDVSHMTITDVVGTQAQAWLQKLLANDVAKLKVVGKALYSPMLNEQGGVIDDLIVYLAENGYRIISNAATREKDVAWFQKTAAPFDVQLTVRTDLAILAVQGPNAIAKLETVKPEWKDTIDALSLFQGVQLANDWFVARTGYTGEDGVEVLLPSQEALAFFDALKGAGVVPCGLGARDTLRLEAGMNLYGHDMDEDITPLEAGMGWTIAWNEREFIGKAALEAKKETGVDVKQVGLVMTTRGVLREGMEVTIPNVGTGVITSGTFSPSLKLSIAIARVPAATADTAQVDIRGTLTDVRVIKLPFVRQGKAMFEL
ncbi:MAG: glycine cleavage system aminomethyltransferase GcvT [Neisseriaceae bacterium]|nr:glycine cleavage system aminomethyltransferase GcvT [Neisseriaceae bacterium]MBP6862551.1 glycine cleavage system aminomethyltransferase GcvT [Neisseriaceae bacterium]